MPLLAKVGSFQVTNNSGVGVQLPVTGVGFMPKALIFYCAGQTILTANISHTNLSGCLGFGGNQVAANGKSCAFYSGDGLATSICARRQIANDQCLHWLATNGTQAGGMKPVASPCVPPAGACLSDFVRPKGTHTSTRGIHTS